jgi:hypothetical protein
MSKGRKVNITGGKPLVLISVHIESLIPHMCQTLMLHMVINVFKRSMSYKSWTVFGIKTQMSVRG